MFTKIYKHLEGHVYNNCVYRIKTVLKSFKKHQDKKSELVLFNANKENDLLPYHSVICIMRTFWRGNIRTLQLCNCQLL